MKIFKFSKTYIAVFMYRFAFLLFVPFLQGLIFAHQGFEKLFTLYSADLAVVIFLLSVAVIRYKKGKVTLKGRSISVYGGAVFKSREETFSRFSGSITDTQGLFLRIFKGSKVRIFSGTAHTTAYLKEKDAAQLLEVFSGEIKGEFHSGIMRSLLMSVSFSNALTGLLAAVPLIRRASAVIGARQTALIIDGATLEGILKFTGLPPILSRVSSLLFLCWVVGFFTEFFREYGLKLKISNGGFYLCKGLMTKTRAVFSFKAVRAVCFRQSVLMFLLGLYSGEVRLNIRPGRKIHILSAAKKGRCKEAEEKIFGNKGKILSLITPSEEALWGYTYLPFLCVSVCSGGIVAFGGIVIFPIVLGVFAGISSLWFIFRVFAFYSSTLCFYENFIEIRYFSGMNFTRCVVNVENIIGSEITQSIFQRRSGRCNLYFYVANVRRLKLKIKHLRLRDIKNTAEKYPRLSL